MYTGSYAINSTAAVTVRSELASFTQRRLCCAGDAADTGNRGGPGCLSAPASAFLARELSLNPAFLYSYYYYLRCRPAFLYRLPNPACCVTRQCSRWEVRCRERAVLGVATRRASASCRSRLFSGRCVVGACRGRVPVCLCRGLLEDAGQELEAEEEKDKCYYGHGTVPVCEHCNSISRKDVAETEGYCRKAERERVSQHWDYGVTSRAEDHASRTKDHRKVNRGRASGYNSAFETSSSENFQGHKTPQSSHSRDESTTQIGVQKFDAALERNQHMTSLSEIKHRPIKKKDQYSKEAVDSRLNSIVGSEFSSDSSSQMRQEHAHGGKKQAEAESHSRKASGFLNATCEAEYNQRKETDVEVNNTNEALVARLVEEVRRQSIEIEKLRESYKALESRSELKNFDRTEAVARIETNEFNSASIANLVEELKMQLIEINKLSKSYQELNSSVAYKNDTQVLSHSNRQSVSNFNDRKECTTSAMNLVNEEREQQIRYDQSTVNQKKVVTSSEIYETDHHTISSSYEIYKTKLRDEEESSTSTIYITQEGKKQPEQKSLSQESFRKLTGASGISDSENQQSFSLDMALILQSDDKEQRMASALHSIEEWRQHDAKQVQSEEDHQKRFGPAKLPESDSKFGLNPISFTGSRPIGKEIIPKLDGYKNDESKHEEICTSQQISNTDSRLGSSNSSGIVGSEEIFFEANVLQDTQGVMEGKTSQLLVQDLKIDRTHTTNILEKGTGSSSSINDAYANVDCGIVSAQMPMQQIQQLDQINNNDSYNDRQDLLESARLLNTSSSSYVAEFVGELKKETSDTLKLDISSGHSSTNTEELDSRQKASRESDIVKAGLQQSVSAIFKKSKSERYTEGITESKPVPQTAGPSDEMWDLSGASQQACEKNKGKKDEGKKEVPEDVVGETSESINSGNAVAKRSGRSLWSLIADIIRINWSSNAGKSHKSTTQSGTRSSSNESTGSEVWFSGHETEEAGNDPSKQKKKLSEEEFDVSSGHQETAYPFSTEKEELTKPENKNAQKDTGAVAETSNTASTIVGSSMVTGTLGLNVDEKVGFSIPSVSGVHSSSVSKNTVLSTIGSGTEKPGINPDPSKQRNKLSEEECDVSSRHQESAYPFSTKREESTKPENKNSRQDMGSFVKTSNTASASVGSSMVIGTLGLNVDEKVGFIIPSVSGVLTSSASNNTVLSSIGSGIEKPGINPVQENVVGSAEHDLLIENPHEKRGPDEGDGDLRRRKFQRNKQVLRDTFDEWEEAHKLETEQRQKDEFFMKEALLEAKKAADSWEVPVGAVLVQNGNIIARSGNMVEECRDSTAHAEIVCIREASKVLKTWRLSETTLYVTLEPCAMCAGAILQARVDTVVWGAPNKLLGADGSWVRLFPGGVEGKTSLDMADQMVGPIHPFHPKIIIRRGVLSTECADVMQQFFQLRRKGKKQETPGPSHLPISKHPTRFLAKMHDVFSMMFCL